MRLPQPLSRRLKFVFAAAACIAVLSTGVAHYANIRGAEFLLDYVDVPLHLLSGFVSAAIFVIAVHFIFDASTLQRLPKFFAMLSIIGFVALVVIAWEILEYFSDRYLRTMVQLTIADTLKDMIVGLLGAAPVALSWPRPLHWT